MDERPRTMGRQWISAPEPPAEAALASLVGAFRNEPRIAEAWLTGSRVTPDDGAPPYETTDVALVLDPPTGPGDDGAMVDLIHSLREAAPDCDAIRGWLVVSGTQMRARQDAAILLYSR